MAASDTIEAEGHLIDSGHLSAIFDKIIEFRAQYEIVRFDIGRTNDDASRIEMRITAPDAHQLDELMQQLTTWGCHPVSDRNALVKPAEKDRCVPDDFYSTTNHRTHVRVGGGWKEVEKQRMEVAGLRGAKLYAGSWSEWEADSKRPIEKGASSSPSR